MGKRQGGRISAFVGAIFLKTYGLSSEVSSACKR